MKIEKLYKFRTFFIKYGRKVGFTCSFLAIFSISMVQFTSLDSIFFELFFVFLLSSIFLLTLSLATKNNKNIGSEPHRSFNHHDSMHPFSPFYRK